MKNLFPIASVAALAAGLFACGPASAFTISDVEINQGQEVTLLTPIADTYAFGQILLTTDIGTIDAWCIDLYHDINVGSGQSLTYTFDPFTNAITDGNGKTLSTQTKFEIAGLIANGDSLLAGGAGDTLPGMTQSEISLATQLAIWSVEYPTTFTYTESDANAVLETNFLIGDATNLNGIGFALINGSGLQGLATADGGFIVGNIPSIPEPTSLALLGAGLAGLRLARRKQRS